MPQQPQNLPHHPLAWDLYHASVSEGRGVFKSDRLTSRGDIHYSQFVLVARRTAQEEGNQAGNVVHMNKLEEVGAVLLAWREQGQAFALLAHTLGSLTFAGGVPRSAPTR